VLYFCTSFSHYIPLLWAVVNAVVAFLILGVRVFIVHMLCFLCFLVVMCFLNKLMMMMIIACFILLVIAPLQT